MNKSAISAVCKRDLRGWFGNPTGYVFVVLFVLLAAVAMVVPREFFQNNLANLDTLNTWFPLLATLFVCAITMGMWATERTQGTQELLMTLPAEDSDILLGKYLAAVGVFTMALLFTLTIPVGLSMLGSPDWGQLLCNYLGYWLLGLLLIAVAMLGSQLSDNLAVSFVLGAIFCVVLLYGDWMAAQVWPDAAVAWSVHGPWGQFHEFARGLVSPAGLFLFFGLAAAFLYLNLALLSRRHWRLGEDTAAHRAVRFAALAVGSVALAMIGVYALPRADVTVERIHSLSAETGALLGKLDAEQPVFVTAYLSDDVPNEYVETRRSMLNLLDQFDSMGGGALQVRVVPTELFSEDAREAQSNYGIQPRVVRSTAGANYSEKGIFLGLAFRCGTEDVVVPFIDRGTPIEYEMMRSVRTVTNTRRRVGVLRTDVELNGGFDPATFRPKPKWQIINELELQYKVDRVDPDTDYPEGLDALLVPQANTLGQEQMDRLRAWIADGHPTLLIEDPEPFDQLARGTGSGDPKGGRQNPMMGMQQPPGEKGDLQGFLGALGLSMSVREVIWDSSGVSFPYGRVPPELLFIGGDGLNGRDVTTRGLQRVVAMWAGALRFQERPGLNWTPLVRSAARSAGTIERTRAFRNPFEFGPMSDAKIPDMTAPRVPKLQDHVLCARIEGKPAEGKERGINVIVMADLDMITSQFFDLRRQVSDPNFQFDNVAFVLNCIDDLVGDASLIDLRSRRPLLRSLERVTQAQQRFEDEWNREIEAAEQEANKALEVAQTRLDEAVKQVQDNPNLDEYAKEIQVESTRAAEQRRLEVQRQVIENEKLRRLQEATYDRDANKRVVQATYQGWTLGLTPLPALAVGILVFFRRRNREALIVPDRRQVSGGAA